MSDSSGKKVIAILKLILLVVIIAGIPAFLYLRYGSDIFSKDTAAGVVEYLRHNSSIAFLLIIGIQIIRLIFKSGEQEEQAEHIDEIADDIPGIKQLEQLGRQIAQDKSCEAPRKRSDAPVLR